MTKPKTNFQSVMSKWKVQTLSDLRNSAIKIAGKLIDKGSSTQYKFGLYTVLNEEGEQFRFHGSSQLDDLMLTIVIGDNIMVEYVDSQKTPKGDLKLFSVLRKKGE